MSFDPVFLQAAIFTALNALFVSLTLWWFYFSRIDAPPRAAAAPSPRMARLIALALGISALQLVGGALWDASMHIRTGQIPGGSDFLWPPHIMLYSAFLISFVVALAAIGALAVQGWRRGARDPRQWMRGAPYLGAVALASIYAIFSIPGDALWHQLFGLDLSAWSPPHVLIALMMSTVTVCGVALQLQAARHSGWSLPMQVGMLLLLGLMLNVVYIVGVLEWELPRPLTAQVAIRPLWAYPVVGGALALITLVLAQELLRLRWAGTGAALAFFAVRGGVMLALGLTGNIVPDWPLTFLLGAILLDWNAQRTHASLLWRDITGALAFTLGYLVIALPLLALHSSPLPFSAFDYLMSALVMFVLALLLQPLARWAAARLMHARPAAEPSPAAQRDRPLPA